MPSLFSDVMFGCMTKNTAPKVQNNDLPVSPKKSSNDFPQLNRKMPQQYEILVMDLMVNDYRGAQITYNSSNIYKLDEKDNIDNIEEWPIFIGAIQIALLRDPKKFIWFMRNIVSDYDRYLYFRYTGIKSYFKEHERSDSLKRYCLYKSLVNRIHAKLVSMKDPKLYEMISYIEHTGMIKNRILN